MGKLIVPRHTADLDYIIPALKIYYDAKDWVDNATYKDKLVASLINSGKESERNSDETHYTKCSEISRYFGFLERAEPGKASSDVRITESGISFYEAYVNGDTSAIQEIIIEVLETVVFGRNNEGCGSDIDCEAPNVVVVSALLLDGITNKEAAYILSEFIKETNFSEILLSVKYNRLYGDKLKEPTVTSDIKFIPFFKRIGFMEDANGGLTVVKQDVIKKFRKRLEALPLTNTVDSDGLHEEEESNTEVIYQSRQIIYYGAPGTGKSKTIKDVTEIAERDNRVFRTTFHPDSDYSTFVGAYKPTMKTVADKYKAVAGKDEEITYTFVPQAFLQAYVEAWKTEEKVYLIIEEINRGNCAQIFGDLFQLLDRGDDGRSEYPINADSDIANYVAKELEGSTLEIPDEVRTGNKLILPGNLYIWATMNTSDQSLFPIDSAFKRRWAWKYLPIEDAEKNWKIVVNGQRYDWYKFLKAINTEVFNLTHSEDKELGYFFAKAENGIINAETLVNKVYFYLWNDVFKDYDYESQKAFRNPQKNKPIAFRDFFKTGHELDEVMAEQVLLNLELNKPEENAE